MIADLPRLDGPPEDPAVGLWSRDLPLVVDLGAEVLVVDGLDGVELAAGEQRQCRGGRVLAGLLWVARAGNDGGHARLLDDPGQGGLSRSGSGRGQRGELAGRFHAGVEVDTGKCLAGVERLAVPVEI